MMTGCCDVIDSVAYLGPLVPTDTALAITGFVGTSLFNRGCFSRKFELWSLREVLNVVRQVIPTGLLLSGYTNLETCL
jgi:hypothetical protein